MQLNQINQNRKLQLQLSYIWEVNNETQISQKAPFIYYASQSSSRVTKLRRFSPKQVHLQVLARDPFLSTLIPSSSLFMKDIISKQATCLFHQSFSWVAIMQEETGVIFKVKKRTRSSHLTLFCREKQSELHSLGMKDHIRLTNSLEESEGR